MNLPFTKQKDQVQPAGNMADLTEYQRQTLLWILLLESVASVMWQMFENNQTILLLAVVFHALALWLVFRNTILSGIVWFLAISTITIISVSVYHLPILTLVFGLIPFLAILIFGLLPGLFAEGAVAGLMILVAEVYPDIDGLRAYIPAVIGCGLFALAVGGIFRYWFVNTIQVYYGNYCKAAAELEEARQERLEFKQIQEDLTLANRELARLTRQLKMTSQLAEEARQAKEAFVATVSHELRTPLNMIIGFSEVIAQSPRVYGTRLPPTLLADIASIQRNSQHLLELVNDVLDLSQVDMGNLSIARSECSLKQMVHEAFEVIRPLFHSKGLYLTAELPAEDITIVCDHTRIREVIINLLSNAGRFTEKGGVTLRGSLDETSLTVSVEDTGPGISPDDQRKLFEPFQQLDSSIRRRHGGSGLGLVISKRFVEMHGGTMWLESSPGSGTTFIFTLPKVDVPALNGEVSGKQKNSVSRWVNPYALVDARVRPFKAPSPTHVPRCVIFEEGTIAQKLFERYLGDVEIVSARDMDQAVERLSESPTQLLVINHPQAGEILHTICAQKGIPFGLPVMAFWLPGSVDMASSLHIQKYLIKPVNKEMLLRSLEPLGPGVRTILLVDDNPEVLQLFGRILTSADHTYKVLRASDGRQALEMLRKRKPDAVILDLVMPEIDGFAVIRAMADDPTIGNIPVIVISAQDPAGIQRIKDTITLAREGGFSPRDLLALTRLVGFQPDPQQNFRTEVNQDMPGLVQ